MTLKKRKYIYLILSALLPAIVFALVFVRPSVTQGGYNILTSDLNGQYVAYMSYFRQAVLSGDGLSFTFSGILGMDTVALIGYYLLSPFNLLVFLFPAEHIGRALFWIILSKITLSGLTAGYYFGRKRDYDYRSLIFSSTYALSGFVFAYFMNIMWLDALYMLPLIAVGIDRLISDGYKKFYIIVLTYTFIVCYYSGYMAAGFALLYFLYLLFREKRSGRDIFRRTGLFLGSSILSGVMSAIVLVPVAISQLGSRAVLEGDVQNETFSHIASRYFTGVFSFEEFEEGAPHVYVGMLVVFLVLLYFLPHKNKRPAREIIASAVLVLAFILSFSIPALDKVWHIFDNPHDFYHRYSFIFVFVLLIIAEKVFTEELKNIISWSYVVAASLIVGAALMIMNSGLDTVNDLFLILDSVTVIIIAGILSWSNGVNSDPIYEKACLRIVALLQAIMIFVNGWVYVNVFTFDDRSTDGYYEAFKPVADSVSEYDSGFYRMEKNRYNTLNDAMMFSYNGLSHFSSSDRYIVRDMMGSIGYNQSNLWIFYAEGATLAGDSLMGLKYMVSDEEVSYYNHLYDIDGYGVYENPYALPIGFGSSSDIASASLDSGNVFENQEKIYSAVMGEDVHLFNYYDYDMKADEGTNLDTTDYNFFTCDTEGTGVVRINFTAEDSNPTYLYLESNYTPEVEVYVNGKDLGIYLTTYNQGILPIGAFSEGEEVEIVLQLLHTHAGFEDPQIASLDLDELEEAASEIKTQGWSVSEHSSSEISASVDMNEDGYIFTTIPYYDGWEITVDGASVQQEEVLGTLMAIPVTSGHHEIHMEYKIPGLAIGAGISGAGVLVFAGWWLLGEKRIRKEEHQPET